MTFTDQVINLISETLIDNEDFTSAFCRGCPAISRAAGEEDYCPAAFTPSDGSCRRREDWNEIESAAEEIALTVAER